MRAQASGRRALDFDTLVVENARKASAFRTYLREVAERRGLVRVLAGRQLKSQYEINIVGFGWWLLEPLTLAAVYYILVTVLTKRNDPKYLLVVLASLLPFKWFQQSVIQSMNTMRAHASLVTDVYFPRALLPITETVVGMAHFGVGLLVMPVFMLILGVAPTPYLAFLPLVIFVEMLLALGFSYPAAVWGLNYRNLPNLMGNILRLWFYLSPALYETSRFTRPWQRLVMRLNPLTGLFEGYRGAFGLAGFTPVTDPSDPAKVITHYHPEAPGLDLAWTAIVAVIVLAFGSWYFTRRETQFGKML
jgi:lipopolysaccharide transport system permease protein/teichoic acid transport system permease protein